MAKPDFDSPNFTPEPVHYMILHLRLLGRSVREISSEVRQPMALIETLVKSPWAQAQFAEYHQKFLSTLQNKTFEPNAKFFDGLEEKIALLDGMTKSENPSVALRAIELWINHTLGSPVKRSEVKVEGTIGHASLEELRFIRDNGRLPTQQEKLALSAPSIDSEIAPHDVPS